jgi:NAD-dependent dihydropyrimidine dehydrogenase PreA subunit
MPYVITQRCVGKKDTSCYEVCPVDAIYPRPDDTDFDSHDQLYINPTECIDCGACEAACPHSAIFFEGDVPLELASQSKLDSDFFRRN